MCLKLSEKLKHFANEFKERQENGWNHDNL